MQLESRRSEGAAGLDGAEQDWVAAGEPARGEYRCVECGYGVAVRVALPACPMCRGRRWEETGGSPYGPIPL